MLKILSNFACLIVLLASLYPGVCPAQVETPVSSSSRTAQTAPYPAGMIMVISRSDITALTAGDKLRHYRNIEAGLLMRLEQKLFAHGLAAQQVLPEESLNGRHYRNLLAFKIENVDFGFKHPFGRHTTVKVSYVFEDENGQVLRSGEHSEHSKKGWKNCILTISERIAGDVADHVGGKKASTEQVPAEQTGVHGKSGNAAEERLKKLEELKVKGLVTEKEYAAKRREILREL